MSATWDVYCPEEDDAVLGTWDGESGAQEFADEHNTQTNHHAFPGQGETYASHYGLVVTHDPDVQWNRDDKNLIRIAWGLKNSGSVALKRLHVSAYVSSHDDSTSADRQVDPVREESLQPGGTTTGVTDVRRFPAPIENEWYFDATPFQVKLEFRMETDSGHEVTAEWEGESEGRAGDFGTA